MSNTTRRNWMIGGLAGATGVVAAAKVAGAYGLMPPDAKGLYGPGQALSYAAQRILRGNAPAREFPREKISKRPFANGKAREDAAYKAHQAKGFAEWRVAIDGMVARPATLTVAQVKAYPVHSQITSLACEEGWSYIAEWTGARLSDILEAAGASAGAKYVVYSSDEPGWVDSIDIGEARHPQTFVAYGMNGGELAPGFGGPLRLRVPRQLGYKRVKFLPRIHVTDELAEGASGAWSGAVGAGYQWYAGI
jgi:DMSO/TMAO reductase YedYZ molybdopterin-dependent catalytic subunit